MWQIDKVLRTRQSRSNIRIARKRFEYGNENRKEMAGGGNSPVVAIKLNGASNGVPESWNEGKLLGGDVVLQVSICSDLDSI